MSGWFRFLRRRTDRVIQDDDYITWLVEEHSQLLPYTAILEKAREVFLKLKNDTETANSFSQLMSKELLWPASIKLANVQRLRFFGQGETTFTFLGRAFVREVADSDCRRIFLYGPQGVGKSHILAAVALVLSVRFAKGEAGSLPVCYIPDMADALNTPQLFLRLPVAGQSCSLPTNATPSGNLLLPETSEHLQMWLLKG